MKEPVSLIGYLPKTKEVGRWLSAHPEVVVFAAALIVTLINLGAEDVWFDEAFTALDARLPLSRLIGAVAADVHPPLWFLLEWVNIRLLGLSEFSLRLPAALFHAGAVAALFRLVSHLSDRQAGYLAAGLAALLPGQIWIAQEARTYALLSCLAIMALNALYVDRNWHRFWLLTTLVSYTHSLALMYVAMLGVLAVTVDWRNGLRAMLKVGFAYLPWLFVLLRQILFVNSSYWIPDVSTFNGISYWLLFTTVSARAPFWILPLALAVVAVFSAIGLYVAARNTKHLSGIGVMAIMPPIMLALVNASWRSILVPKPLNVSTLMLIGLWAIVFMRASNLPRTVMAGLFLPVLIVSLYGYFLDPTTSRNSVEARLDVVNKGWQPGDIIYHADEETYVLSRFYLNPDEYPAYLAPVPEGYVVMTKEFREVAGVQTVSPDELGKIGTNRAWVLWEAPSQSSALDPALVSIIERYPVLLWAEDQQINHTRFFVVLVDLSPH